MFKAIQICKPGQSFKKIGEVIQEHANKHNFTVCEEFCGHGVGKELHMQPLVRHHSNDNNCKEIMVVGQAFTIEPIILMFPYNELIMWEDDWTVVAPNNPSAQWEHCVLITENGYEILTKRNDEIFL